jgi:hypothetical protein
LKDKDFYDEYRRTLLSVKSFLPLIKEDRIKELLPEHAYSDDRILIGFPDGMPMESAIDKFCDMMFSFLLNGKDISDCKLFVLPCNTLSPALLKMKESIQNEMKLEELIAKNRYASGKADIKQKLKGINI